MSLRRKTVITVALLALLCIGASAQSYSVRVKFNTNIRAKPSLSGARLETVRAGTVLQVLDEFNKWFKVNRGGGAWMASWVAHDRVAGQPAAAADAINNCCFVDRQCQRDSQWVDGYYAFQRGECQAPASARQTEAPAPTSSSPAVNNCCFVDRQCQSDREWTDGYYAYQRGQCGPVSQAQARGNCCDSGWSCQREHEFIYGAWAAQHNRCFPTPDSPARQSYGPHNSQGHIRITELTPGFTTMVNAGFTLLRNYSPHWYNYVVNAITEYRERHCCGTGVYGASGVVVYHHAPHSVRPYIRQDDYTMAENMVHEACHVYQDRQGRGVGGDLSWVNEYECELYAQDFAMAMGGISQNIGPDSVFLNDPMNRALWWWSP